MTMKNDAKFEEKLTFCFKIDMGIWRILTQVLESLKYFHFSVLILSKVYIVWAKKVQRCYLSWPLKMIQNLERNRLVVSKLTWGIWQILTWALKNLKNLHFNGLLLNKVHNIWAKKVKQSFSWWYWILMQHLKENWLVLSKMTWGI